MPKYRDEESMRFHQNLREERKKIRGMYGEAHERDNLAETLRHAGKGSIDPIYRDQHKNK